MAFVNEVKDSDEIDIGKYLKSHRVNNKISIEELSKITKIRKENITAIEESEKATHIPQTYYRGYIKSYCKFFGIDSKSILEHIESKPYIPPRNRHARYKVQKRTLQPYKKNKHSGLKAPLLLIGLTIIIVAVTATLTKTKGIRDSSLQSHKNEQETLDKNNSDIDSIIKIQ